MSYEIAKGIKLNKKEGKIIINCACNNCAPLRFYEWEYCSTETNYEKKLFNLAMDMFRGSIHPRPAKYRQIVKNAYSIVERYCHAINFEDDRFYKASFEDERDRLISEKYISVLLGDRSWKTMLEPDDSLIQELKALNSKALEAYSKKDKEYKEKNILRVTCAWRAKEPQKCACIVLDDSLNKLLYLCDSNKYDSNGHLDNGNNSAVCLGRYTRELLNQYV